MTIAATSARSWTLKWMLTTTLSIRVRILTSRARPYPKVVRLLVSNKIWPQTYPWGMMPNNSGTVSLSLLKEMMVKKRRKRPMVTLKRIRKLRKRTSPWPGRLGRSPMPLSSRSSRNTTTCMIGLERNAMNCKFCSLKESSSIFATSS